jgi:hypothetical protein
MYEKSSFYYKDIFVYTNLFHNKNMWKIAQQEASERRWDIFYQKWSNFGKDINKDPKKLEGEKILTKEVNQYPCTSLLPVWKSILPPPPPSLDHDPPFLLSLW